jgi:hypothetical protein
MSRYHGSINLEEGERHPSHKEVKGGQSPLNLLHPLELGVSLGPGADRGQAVSFKDEVIGLISPKVKSQHHQ